MAPLLVEQIKSLLYRNYLMKKRLKSQTIQVSYIFFFVIEWLKVIGETVDIVLFFHVAVGIYLWFRICIELLIKTKGWFG